MLYEKNDSFLLSEPVRTGFNGMEFHLVLNTRLGRMGFNDSELDWQIQPDDALVKKNLYEINSMSEEIDAV